MQICTFKLLAPRRIATFLSRRYTTTAKSLLSPYTKLVQKAFTSNRPPEFRIWWSDSIKVIMKVLGMFPTLQRHYVWSTLWPSDPAAHACPLSKGEGCTIASFLILSDIFIWKKLELVQHLHSFSDHAKLGAIGSQADWDEMTSYLYCCWSGIIHRHTWPSLMFVACNTEDRRTFSCLWWQN